MVSETAALLVLIVRTYLDPLFPVYTIDAPQDVNGRVPSVPSLRSNVLYPLGDSQHFKVVLLVNLMSSFNHLVSNVFFDLPLKEEFK